MLISERAADAAEGRGTGLFSRVTGGRRTHNNAAPNATDTCSGRPGDAVSAPGAEPGVAGQSFVPTDVLVVSAGTIIAVTNRAGELLAVCWS